MTVFKMQCYKKNFKSVKQGIDDDNGIETQIQINNKYRETYR